MATPGGFDPVSGGPTVPAGPTGPGGPGGTADVGLAPNVASALCYLPLCCLNVVWAIYAVAVEKQSRFVRFHALQSLLWAAFLVAVTIVFVILNAISGILGIMSGGVAFLLWFGGGLFLAYKAYNNEEFELPQLGVLAKQWS